MNIMSPDHQRWDEFCERLEGPEGCDFKERVPGDVSTVEWKCGGGFDQSKARAILKAMGFNEDAIAESCALFASSGGHCDCEILFNVK